MDITLKFTTPAILFLLTLLFGFWLSRMGKPYNGALFNIHKLIALGTVVLAGIQVFDLLKGTNPQFLVVVLFAATGLCVAALFASGAFMSLGKFNYEITLVVHQVAPVLALIAIGLAIRLLSVWK
jgi:hypothetical protein